jgi:hypothetical protein
MATVTLASGATVTQNLSLTAATRTISGRITDLATSAGLPGVQVQIQPSGQNNGPPAAVVFTDGSGNFTAPATSGAWDISASGLSLLQLGYLNPNNSTPVDASSGSVSGASIQVAKETALISGSVKDSAGNPLASVSLYASDSANVYDLYDILTDANGNYTMGVVAGTWNVGLDSSSAALVGYITPNGSNVTVAAGQAVQSNFTAQHASVQLTGKVTNASGAPMSGLTIGASLQNSGNSWVQTDTAADGSFTLYVTGGSWMLQLSSDTADSDNLVCPSVLFTMPDGVTVSNITYVVQAATAHITGTVEDNYGNAIAGIGVSAYTTINNISYNAWVQTGSDGSYQLPVINGTWSVGVDSGTLSNLGYNPLDNQSAVVSGTNQTVNFSATSTVTLTPFAQWQVNNFGSSTATNALATADPDHDGLSNLLEYAFNTNPLVANASPVTTSVVSSHLTITVAKNPAATDATFTAEVSSDLVNWSTAGVTVLQNTTTTFQAQDNTVLGAGVRRFIRVSVTVP